MSASQKGGGLGRFPVEKQSERKKEKEKKLVGGSVERNEEYGVLLAFFLEDLLLHLLEHGERRRSSLYIAHVTQFLLGPHSPTEQL